MVGATWKAWIFKTDMITVGLGWCAGLDQDRIGGMKALTATMLTGLLFGTLLSVGCQTEPMVEQRPDYRFQDTRINEEGEVSDTRTNYRASQTKYRMDIPSLQRPGNR